MLMDKERSRADTVLLLMVDGLVVHEEFCPKSQDTVSQSLAASAKRLQFACRCITGAFPFLSFSFIFFLFFFV